LAVRLLEIGGGTRPHPLAAENLDLLTGHDLTKPWAVDTESVDAIYASHVLEHIAKGADTLHVMSEAHRVLKPGGTFTIKLPVVGWTDSADRLVSDWKVYADPTHVSLWWLPQGLVYFCDGAGYEAGWVDYGTPKFGPLGSRIHEADAYDRIAGVGTEFHDRTSWWAVGGSWEGLANLVR